MKWHRAHAVLIVAGAMLLVLGFSSIAWAGSPRISNVAQPPRPTLTPRPQPEGPAAAAMVTVVQRPTPNHASRRSEVDFGVSPGSVRPRQSDNGIVVYEIEVVNRGAGRAHDTMITMPFDPAEVRVLDATFSQPRAHVTQVLRNALEMRTGPLEANGGRLTATVRLLTRPGAAQGAGLGERLTYRWSDDRAGGTGRSNLPILVVAERSQHQPLYTLSISPAGQSGSYVFSSGVFSPGEPVSLWYHTPGGRDIAVATTQADADGMVRVEFSSGGLPAGSYMMVAHGAWTTFSATGRFEAR